MSSMLSGVVTGLLVKYLGEFIELSPENLRIGLAAGDVDLKNLKFRPEALRDLNLPIQVVQGVLGHLELSIPWTSLWSSPTKILVEDVYLLVHPKENVFDEDFEQRIQATKERFLQMRELFNTPEEEKKKQAEQAAAAGSTWTERLVAAIINNVQVSIGRIHIRYEQPEFSCGVSLNALEAMSCDENFEPGIPASAVVGGLVRKVCSLDSLSVYWDSQTNPLQYRSDEDFCAQMRQLIGTRRMQAHQYVVHPLSGKLKVAINQKEQPKIRLEAKFEEVQIALHETQFRDVIGFSDHLTLEARGARYRRLRPSRPGATPRQMWQYVIGAVQQDLAVIRNVWSWPWIKAMMNDRREYVKLWCHSKQVGGVSKMSVLDQEQLRALEFRLEYESIVQFRELGELLWERKQAEASKVQQQVQAETSWLGRMVWGSAQAEKQRVLNADEPVTGALLQDLNRTLVKRHSEAESRNTRRDMHEGMVIDFILDKGSIQLNQFEPKSQTVSDLMEVEFQLITAHLLLGSSTLVKFDMASLEAKESISVPGQQTLTASRRMFEKSDQSFLGMELWLNPPEDVTVDVSVKLWLRPFDVLFSMPMVERLGEFFATGQSETLDSLFATAQESAAELQRGVINQLRGIVSGKQQSRIALDMQLEAPNVIVPSTFTDPHCPRAVAVLGKIHFKTAVADDSAVKQKDGKTHISMRYFYQQSFLVNVSDIQLILCNQEDWRAAMQASSRCKIIQDLGMEASLDLLTFPTNMLPKIKLDAKISDMRGNVCAEMILDILTLVKSLAPPSADGKASTNALPSTDQASDSSTVTEDSQSSASEVEEASQFASFLDSGVPDAENSLPEELDDFVFDRALFDAGKNPKAIDMAFSAETIEFLVYKKQADDKATDIMVLHSKAITLKFEQRRSDMRVHVHLGRIGLEDRLSGPQKWMLDGGMDLPVDQSLVKVTFTAIPRSSPLFSGADSELSVQLSDIGLNFHRETILYLQNTVDAITAGMKDAAGPESVPKEKGEAADESTVDFDESGDVGSELVVDDGTSTDAAQKKKEKKEKKKKKSKQKVDNTSSMLLKVALGSVCVQLCKEDVFVVLDVHSSEVSMDIKNNGTMLLDTSVGYFEVRGGEHTSEKWPRIAYTEKNSPETALFVMETFLPDVEGYPGYDSRVKLSLATVKAVYRNVVVEEVVAYFQEMDQMRSYLFSAANAAIEEGAKSSGRLVLDVTINNPYVQVPVSSSSDAYLELDLGKTTVVSSYEDNKQKLSLGINQIGLRSCSLDREGGDDILQKVDISLLVAIPEETSLNNITSLSGMVTPLVMQLDEKKVELVSNILKGNLSEGDPVAPRGAKRHAVAEAATNVIDNEDLEEVIARNVDVHGDHGPDPAPSVGFELTAFRVEEVSLAISSSQSGPLASFHLQKLYAHMNSSGAALFSIGNILMSDNRSEKNDNFTRVIYEVHEQGESESSEGHSQPGQGQASNSDPVLKLQYNGGKISVIVNPIRCILVLECLLQLYEFQTQVTDGLLLALKEYNERNEAKALGSPTGEGEDDENIAPIAMAEMVKSPAKAAEIILADDKSQETLVEFVLKGFEVMAVENLLNADSRGISCSFSTCVNVRMTQSVMDVEVELNDFVVNKLFSMEERDSTAAIILPWRLGVSYNVITGHQQRIDIIMSHLDVVFSHSDYALVMALVTRANMLLDPESYEESQKAKSNELEATKIIIEPSRAHREGSTMLDVFLNADPISLQTGANERVLSLALGGVDEDLLWLSDSEPREGWIREGNKILLGSDSSRGIHYDEKKQVVCVCSAKSLSEWKFTEEGFIQLLGRPRFVLTAVGDWVELREVEDDPTNQLWISGNVSHEERALAAEMEKDKRERELKQREQAASNMVEALNVVFHGLRVRMVDDLIPGQIAPLVSVNLGRVDVFVSSWSHNLSMVADFDLSADHFDSRLQTWEPVLRGMDEVSRREGAWKCQVVARKEKAFQFDVVAKHSLTFTVTRAMMASVNRLNLIWTGTQESIKKVAQRSMSHLPSISALKELMKTQDKQEFHLHLICNRHGKPFRWRIGSKMEPKELGHTKGHNIDAWDGGGGPALRVGEKDTLSIYLDDSDKPTLHSLPIDGARTICFQTEEKKCLVYEIRYELGSRVLELRSNVLLSNSLHSAAVAMYCNGDAIGVLDPMGSLAVPLPLSDGSISFDEPELTPPINTENLKKLALMPGADGVLQYSRLVTTSRRVAYAIHATGTPDVTTEDLYSWIVSLDAPLRLRNLLNVTLYVRLRNNLKDVMTDTAIEPGDTLEVLLIATHISIRHAANDKWSSFSSLESLKSFSFHSGGDVLVDNVMETSLKRHVSFWTSFWLINNTDHMIAAQEIPLVPYLERGKPYMYSGSDLNVSVEKTRAKDKLELASAPASGILPVGTLELGVRVSAAPSHFWRTKIVQFDNRFHLVNMCDRRICVGQTKTMQQVFVEPLEQIPFRWFSEKDPKLIRVKIAEDGWYWSGAFEIKEVSLFEIITPKSGCRARLTVQTTTDAPITAIIFRPSNTFSIYQVVNSTHTPILLQQQGVESDDGEFVHPKERIPYAWPEPSRAKPKVVLSAPRAAGLFSADGEKLTEDEGNLPTYSLDTIDSYPEIVIGLQDGSRISCQVRVFFQGPTKVFEIRETGTRQVVGMNLKKPASAAKKGTSTNIVNFSMSMQLHGISVALIDARPREVMHLHFGNVRATYEDGTRDTCIGLDIQRMQMDSMLYNGVFPVALWPNTPQNKWFMHLAINQAKGYEGITFLNGIEFALQEAEIRVDEAFATHVYSALSELFERSTEDEIDWDSLAQEVADYRHTSLTTSDMVYAREIYVGPIRLELSYTSCPWAAVSLSDETGQQVEAYLGYLGEIDGVHLNLGMLNLDDAYHSREALTWLVVDHYKWQVMQGFFSLLGAVPILGAPVEMFRGVTTGVKEAFFLPAQGVSRSPADFGDGLRKGSSALFHGTVGTLFKEVGKVTRTAGGLAAKLTLDEEYQLKREKASKNQAKNAGQGFFYAARDVGTGLLGGVSGVVMNPVKGAQKEGFSGFGKGILTGLIGAVTKPVVGVLDATSQVTHGIKNSGQDDPTRLRRPRQFDQAGTIRLFDGLLAEAQEVLQRTDPSAAAVALFLHPELFCLQRTVNERVILRDKHVLLSNKAVYLVRGNEPGAMHLEWKIPLGSVGKMIVEGTSIKLVHKARSSDVVREAPMQTFEEAIFVYRKISRSLELENLSAPWAVSEAETMLLPPTVQESSNNLIRNMEDRLNVEKRVLQNSAKKVKDKTLHHKGKGKGKKEAKAIAKGKEEASVRRIIAEEKAQQRKRSAIDIELDIASEDSKEQNEEQGQEEEQEKE